jgi:putative oxidoreductase
MNRTLWVFQVVFGVYFAAIGVLHFIVPEGLPGPMEWMYDLSTGAHVFIGIAELAGGIGLILPAILRIRPVLTPLAGGGLALVMLAAAIWHLTRGEAGTVPQNVVVAAILAFIAYGRWRLAPLSER